MTNNIFKQVALVMTGSVENITENVSKISFTQKFFADEHIDDYEISSQKALANDWKNIGNDMRKGIIKYDRKVTR